MNAPSRRIVVATGNQGKLAEIGSLLQGSKFNIVAQSEFGLEPVAETGDTFLANALLKARHAASATGLIAIADDSGLVVDALAGAPGVYSARYAGEDASDEQNIAQLLRALRDQDERNRGAEFRCVAVVVMPHGQSAPLVAEGKWRGRIALSRHGQSGFGYDPVFFDPQLGKCAAEMTAGEKNARSHRGQAFRRLGELLAEVG